MAVGIQDPFEVLFHCSCSFAGCNQGVARLFFSVCTKRGNLSSSGGLTTNNQMDIGKCSTSPYQPDGLYC